ncbi:PLP-dependent aminotransferase family protein [Piscinibacter sakaiensis]|uniref:aminotransferase-like domain-containing protein n=1 Tax=Piscinibacter sakaiensis TaxID=1547922 RepID=UPI003729E4A0
MAAAVRAARPARTPSGGAARAPDWAPRVKRSLQGARTLSKPARWRDYAYPFVYGHHDPQLFPTEDFRECCMRTLARAQLEHWTPDFETEDMPDLIEQLRTRVLPKRGVFALPEEIIVTVGAQQAFQLLAEALLDSRTRLGFEEPGYPHARNCFALRRPRWVPLRVDADGVVVDEIPALDLVFVTPSQQSPTTATLSLQRRTALLQAADAQDFVVIEDDYEAENLYDGVPIPALKSLDRSGRVVYVGSIAKSLAPALRLGYIVAPAPLVAELRHLRHVVVRHPSAFLQHAYALYLSLGHHESHARRLNQAMRSRVAAAAEALQRTLPDFAFRLPQGGASLWVQAPDWVDAAELALEARRHGVLIEPGDVFYQEAPQPCPCFRLRLSSIAPDRIAPGIEALARAVADLRARVRARQAPRATSPAASSAGAAGARPASASTR